MRKGRKLPIWSVAIICALLLCVPVCAGAIDVDVGELGNGAAGDYRVYDTAHYIEQNGNPYYTLGECIRTDITQCKVHSDTKVIGKYAFLDCKSLGKIVIPHGVIKIEDGAFKGCSNLTNVFFQGTQTEWTGMTAGRDNNDLSGATIHFCGSDGACTDCGAKYLEITKQPTDVLLEAGKKASISLNAVGDGLTYAWYYKNKGASNFTLATGFTGSTYAVEMTSACDGRQVYCVVTDKYGYTETTSVVTLSLKTTVKITKQPTGVLVVNGADATVSFDAVGDGLTYKWYYKNKTATKFSLTTSFESNTYSVSMSSTRDSRQIYCVVTDKYGNTATTNTVTLNLKTVAKITKQPQSVSAVSGAKATVSFSAEGDGLTYKWYYKNKSATKFSLTTAFKSHYYSVDMNSSRAGRQVYCVITDKYGNRVTTNTATLNMKTVAKITKQPVNAYAASGATAKVTVGAVGDGLTYKWYYKERNGSSFHYTSSFKGSTYSVKMNSTRKGRQVYCIITDQYGNSVATNIVTLNLKTVAKITSSPTSVSVKKGSTAKFTVKAVGDGLTYRWQMKTPSGSWKYTTTSGYKTKTLTATATKARNGYRYRCVVTDRYGNRVYSAAAKLTVK